MCLLAKFVTGMMLIPRAFPRMEFVQSKVTFIYLLFTQFELDFWILCKLFQHILVDMWKTHFCVFNTGFLDIMDHLLQTLFSSVFCNYLLCIDLIYLESHLIECSKPKFRPVVLHIASLPERLNFFI